jgi:hypothetical protein
MIGLGWAWIGRWQLAVAIVPAVALLAAPQTAQAVPSLAAQTGQPCTACHIGAFGPALTPFGRAFKITGYTQAGGEGLAAQIPLNAMFLGSWNHTNEDQPGGAGPHAGPNNNFNLDQISVFAAGRITDWAGAFIQGTYSGTNVTFHLDNTDIRVTKPLTLPNDSDLQVGLSANNNPTVQDPYNSSFAWGYRYVMSALAPTPAASPLITGAFAGNSVGVTGYAWYDRRLYFEVGAYGTLDPSTAKTLGDFNGPGRANNPMPYVRLAYEWNWSGQSAQFGGIYMNSQIEPGFVSGFGTDDYNNFVVDGGYQFLGDGTHIVAAYGNFVYETENLHSSFAQGLSASRYNYLTQVNADIQYWYKNTYGITFAIQNTQGSSDTGLYAPAPITGSANGKPNSNAFITEVDWVPFGKSDSWLQPFANLKLGAQYVAYTRFNGGTQNYDGNGRAAWGNNTAYLFAWLIF